VLSLRDHRPRASGDALPAWSVTVTSIVYVPGGTSALAAFLPFHAVAVTVPPAAHVAFLLKLLTSAPPALRMTMSA
jgi:hypothetical protein